MDYNDNEETTLNIVNSLNQGVWQGDTRMCEQGQVIYPGPIISQSMNKNDVKIPSTADPNQPIRMAETKSQSIMVYGSNSQDKTAVSDFQFTNKSNDRPTSKNQPITLSFSNSQQIRLSSSSSSDSSDSPKTTTWGQLKTQLPKEMQNESKCQTPEHSPKCSPRTKKNEKAMASWKSISPTKSSSSSDLDQSNHSTHSNEYANNIFRFNHKKKDFINSTSSNSDPDNGQQETCLTRQQENHEHSNEIHVANQSPEKKCLSKTESPIKKSLNCSGNCNSQHPDNQNNLITSNTSLCENDNDSPKKEKGVDRSADDVCDNEYFYEDDFTVQFDTNLRESSLTPKDTDQNTTILDFPNMVTGSYLCFHNGGSSNISLNNSKASSNVSFDNLCVSNIINNQGKSMQYDSELSGNSGSHNSTMETSSDKDMQGSSDVIELSDGPLFTPTPSNILSTDSLDKGSNNAAEAQMSGSNGSAETNLNVNCCPRKEEYFLSFDGSHSRVSGSETDVSVSVNSQDSYQDHMGQRKANLTSHNSSQPKIGEDLDGLSNSDGQDKSDSFHVHFNKLSPKHKGSHYLGCENLSGTFVKKLIPLNQTIMGAADSSGEENTRTSTTLTAGSKDLSSVSPQFSPKMKIENHFEQPISKFKKNYSRNSEPLFLVGIGKPVEIMSKVGVHSHTLPKVKKLVSWRQLKHFRKSEKSKCISLPELSTSTSWQNISTWRCKNISELSESFHGKRHSASLFEFYQRMKSESNPVSPETMNNLEQILRPNFLDQKYKTAEASDSSQSTHECAHCQCRKKVFAEIQDSGFKAYTNKRIFDWLRMECSASSKDSQRPHSLACQAGPFVDLSSKETLVSPETVALWCGTKTVSSQFPPVTKDCSIQTLQSLQNSMDNVEFKKISKKDQALQTSDFEAEEIMSILSDTFEEFNFLKSDEEISKELLSCPEIVFERNSNPKICRSKSVECRKSNTDGLVNCSCRSYEQGINHIGQSKSFGGLARKSVAPGCRMGISKHYSYQSLPDIAFLSSSLTNDKDESNDSLFDAMKIDLDVPVTIATKTELEQFHIYQQKTYPCHHHHHRPTCCAGNKNRSKSFETASSSSGVSSWSESLSTDTGSCDCRSRSAESPQNDLERLIFYPPHTEKFKASLDCFASKKRAHSLPSKLSECAIISVNPKMEKYANETHPHSETGSKGQYRINKKWTSCSKNPEPDSNENLYALEEEQTPVASPDQQPCCHRSKCNGGEDSEQTDCNKSGFFKTNQEFTESDFYRAVQEDKIIIVGNDCYRGIQVIGIDSTSSSGSSMPNSDRKPLKSCLRKKNRGLKSRSLSAADAMALNFEDLEEKVRNHRHSFGCDEVYIVANEHSQLMMYQADDHAEPIMFYLGKDGGCHMTEGCGNHMENFGSLANFNIQANNSIQGVGDSLSEQEVNSGKRKSVSFASEVSFQAISPMVSPRNLVCDKPAESGFEKLVISEDNPAVAGVLLETGKYIVQDIGVDEVKDEDHGTTLAGSIRQHEEQVSSSSSSEYAPEVFHVAMDTNDNFWLEDVAQEKIGLLMSLSKSAEVLVAHFAKSIDTFDKLRRGNTSDCPELGDILKKLCTTLTRVLEDGLKEHLTGFQMFGKVQITVWKIVEASVEIVPQTRSLCDLVCKVKHITYLMTHQQKFDAFIFGLLNLRLLDFWMQYIRQKEDQLAKFYSSGAILIHSNNAFKKQYDDMIAAVQALALLPFHLDTEFIKEKALVDSKLKTSDMIVLSDSTAVMATSLSESSSGSYSSAKEASSALEITASKALSWLSNIALPKIKTSTESDFLASKSSSFESVSHSADSDNTVCHISEYFSIQGNEKDIMEHCNENVGLKRLFEIYQKVYLDAKVSIIDCDAVMSLTESSRSNHSSQSGFKTFFSTMAARFGENPANQSISLTQSMSNSASNLVSHLWGTSKLAYKKGITEYKFDEEQVGENGLECVDAEDKLIVDNVISSETLQTYVQENEEVSPRDRKSDSLFETSKAKRVSFGIVNLFDKLLLPNSKIEKTDSKPISRIPVPTNRWSWSFGATKLVTTSPIKLPKAATDTDLKVNNRTNKQVSKLEPSTLSKTEQLYPKRSIQLMDTTKGVNLVQAEKSRVVAPPKAS